jgi:ribonucleotide reductase alpha subunit
MESLRKMSQISNLANVVISRTYARPFGNRIETYPEIVERVITGNVRGHNVTDKEIERLRYFMLERKASPAGRGLWISGTKNQSKLGGAALTNCWGFLGDDWNNLVIAADLLMLGGGVGFSVESKYVDQLPKIKKDVVITHRLTKDTDFIVPDTREGWCRLLYKVLEAWFVTGKGFSYSTICVRGPGEIIAGFGGISSGPRPLVRMVENLCGVFTARQGKKLRPIDMADLICCVAQMVVSGNVRRSAILIQGDAWDREFLKAKRWDLGSIPTYRSMANFSIVASDVEHDLRPLFWETYKQGEAFGIINLPNIRKYGRMGEEKKDYAAVVNPCQPGWATVLTPNGISTIEKINVGDLIWSGTRWTSVIKKTNTGTKQVNAYKTKAGTFYGTENHRVVSNGVKVEAKKAKNIDICLPPYLGVPIPLEPQDVMDGMVFGDGTTHKASGDLTLLCIGEKDECIVKNSEVSHLFKVYRPGVGPFSWEIKTTIQGPLPKTYDRKVPDRFRYGNEKKVRGFLRGLYSANGSTPGGRVVLKATSFFVIEAVQEMLSSLGIASYYTTNRSKEIEFNNGKYTCRQSYDLNIAYGAGKRKFEQLIGFVHSYKAEKLQTIVVKIHKEKTPKKTFDIVEVIPIKEEPVFDITVESEDHTYWTGGLHVSNCGEATLENAESCNLQDINLTFITDKNEFAEAARLMHRWGKRVSMEKYHWPQVQEVVNRNHRIGTGITGCLQRLDLFNPDILDYVYAKIQEENITYSKELNIDPSVRTTVIKPSGSLSKAFDSPCEGIHPAYSKYFIQRIRIAGNDPLVPKLQKAGHHIEPQKRLDGSLDPDTMVVDFYVKTPEGVPCADSGFDTWKQLDAVKMAQKHWADQSISVTAYYKDGDIPAIKEWLTNNLSEIKTVSFLRHTGHGFVQAPKEAITEEQYEKLSAKVKPIDFDNIEEAGTIEGTECESGSCPVR